MTTEEMARRYQRRAATILREAERLHGEAVWNLVVRRCQEAVELALKGLLRAAGAEIPKVHDVSGALRRNASRLPPELRAKVDTLVSASRRLREEREPTKKPELTPKTCSRKPMPRRRCVWHGRFWLSAAAFPKAARNPRNTEQRQLTQRRDDRRSASISAVRAVSAATAVRNCRFSFLSDGCRDRRELATSYVRGGTCHTPRHRSHVIRNPRCALSARTSSFCVLRSCGRQDAAHHLVCRDTGGTRCPQRV